MTKPQIKKRLEYLRGELRAERISYGELDELIGLTKHIDLQARYGTGGYWWSTRVDRWRGNSPTAAH